ncbi:MAG: scramblase [Actinobacteria bacterium]|nr:scramblase [Actinomycetota bacterium]
MSDLLERERYVFNQKAKIIEMNTEFAIRDEEGNQIGMVRQEGQSQLKKLARLVSSLDQFMTHTLAVYDGGGQKVVELTRPRKVFKSTVLVNDGQGNRVGKIVQENMIGKIHFGLEDSQGQSIGAIRAENWRAWNFSIQDPSGTERPRGRQAGLAGAADVDARVGGRHRPRAEARRPGSRLVCDRLVPVRPVDRERDDLGRAQGERLVADPGLGRVLGRGVP